MSLSADFEVTRGAFHLRVAFRTHDGILSLLGASGCGKSLTLRCIAGIERPDRGRIVLGDRVLFDSDRRINLPPQQRRIGYLFQQYALFPHLTVAQNIAFGVRGRRERAAVTASLVKRLYLEGTESLRPAALSGGQQQRVALARILASRPDALLLDEPFSALDAHLRFRTEQTLRELLKDFPGPVLLVSHDRDEVFRLSSEIAIMKDGQIETIGEKHAVFAAPATVGGAILTGCKNLCRVTRLDAAHLRAADWGATLRVPFSDPDVTHIGIRMHDILPQPGENELRCAVIGEIENPFSYTVQLRPIDAPSGAVIGMELPKPLWEARRADALTVSLPAAAILPLKG